MYINVHFPIKSVAVTLFEFGVDDVKVEIKEESFCLSEGVEVKPRLVDWPRFRRSALAISREAAAE